MCHVCKCRFALTNMNYEKSVTCESGSCKGVYFHYLLRNFPGASISYPYGCRNIPLCHGLKKVWSFICVKCSGVNLVWRHQYMLTCYYQHDIFYLVSLHQRAADSRLLLLPVQQHRFHSDQTNCELDLHHLQS